MVLQRVHRSHHQRRNDTLVGSSKISIRLIGVRCSLNQARLSRELLNREALTDDSNTTKIAEYWILLFSFRTASIGRPEVVVE